MIKHEDGVCDVTRTLIEHAFRQAGIDCTTNTPDQDINLVKEYSLNACRAQMTREPAPVITDKIVSAAQRMAIRAAARGKSITFAFELVHAIEEKENARLHAHTDQNASMMDRILTLRPSAL